MTRTVLMITAFLLVAPVGADAKVALKDDPTIENGLTLFAVGDRLDETCPEIKVRELKTKAYALSLFNHARGLGYSTAEIDAYLDSEPDKTRIKAHAANYLKSKGANLNNTASICEVGRKEVADQTSVGRYLRVSN